MFGLDAELGAKFLTAPRGCILRMPACAAGTLEVELRHPAPFLARNAALALACVERLGLFAEARRPRSGRPRRRRREPPRSRGDPRPFPLRDSGRRAYPGIGGGALGTPGHPHPRRHGSRGLARSGQGRGRGAARAARKSEKGLRNHRGAHPLAPRGSPGPRSCAPSPLPSRCEAIEDPARALREALRPLSPGDLLCVTGSMYLAGAARRILARSARRPALPAGRASPENLRFAFRRGMGRMNRIDLEGRFAVVTGSRAGHRIRGDRTHARLRSRGGDVGPRRLAAGGERNRASPRRPGAARAGGRHRRGRGGGGRAAHPRRLRARSTSSSTTRASPAPRSGRGSIRSTSGCGWSTST